MMHIYIYCVYMCACVFKYTHTEGVSLLIWLSLPFGNITESLWMIKYIKAASTHKYVKLIMDSTYGYAKT